MKDSSSIIYAPAWVKFSAIALFCLALSLSGYVTIKFIGKSNNEDYILISMSLAQMALSGLAVSIVIFSRSVR